MEVKKIHSEFNSMLYNFINSRVDNSDDAADILQEVFIKIAAKIETLQEDEKLKSWIFAITRNAIIDYYRKSANRKKTELTEKVINEIKDVDDRDATMGLDKCLKGFIQKLPEEYRDVIIDSELKGIKQKDLAVKYNLAYPSIRSRVQRGRSKLKEMLLKCCSIEADSRGNILEVKSKDNCGTECGDCE